MKTTYSKIKDQFTHNGKELKKTHKGFLEKVCQYVISEVSKGKSLADLFPVESEVAPLLADILDQINDNKKLAEDFEKASKTRLTLVKEKLLSAAEDYRNKPDQENRDVFSALEKTFSSLRKSSEDSGTTIIKFFQVMPEDFWSERTKTAPNTPLSLIHI